MNSRREFGLLEMSAIREVANIGLGHATTAIANIMGAKFDMHIPNVETVALERVPEMIGDPSEVAVGVLMPIDGDLRGHIAFFFPWKSAQVIWKTLIGTSPEDPSMVDELGYSVMLELGNMINSAYMNAIADMAFLRMHATPPMVSIDLTSSIASSIVAEAELEDVIALVVETKIVGLDQEDVEGYFLCIPTAGGLHYLLNQLGVSEAA